MSRQVAFWGVAGLLLACGLVQSAAGSCPDQSSAEASYPVYINEILADPSASGADGWIELANRGGASMDLGGYGLGLLRTGVAAAWVFPSGTTIAPGAYLVIGLGSDGPSGSIPSRVKLPAGLGAGTVALWDGTGSVVSRLPYPAPAADVSFGVKGTGGVAVPTVQAASPSDASTLAALATPTPGAANSGPRGGAPTIVGTTRDPDPRPDGSSDIPISTSVIAQGAGVSGVQLAYVIGYGDEASVDMTPSEDGCGTYTATIPKSALAAGALVRWAVRATDASGASSRDPAADGNGTVYYGTILADPSDAASLPILELYCSDPRAPWSTGPESNGMALTGGKGGVTGCSAWLDSEFYDGLLVRRRGATSLAWPKPKVKISSNKQGKIFRIADVSYRVSSFGLNSNWLEPGENTFTREPLVWDVFGQMGMPALASYQLHVRMNGEYFGRFSMQEEWSVDALKERGVVTGADGTDPILWKSNSGWLSNLRWDVAPSDMLYYYNLEEAGGGDATSATAALTDLTRSLAGGGTWPRSKYLFQAIDLPRVTNFLAAQALILNQDRCTKNFELLRDNGSGQWSMLAWDTESGFGIDRGLGGQPAPDYCILACEQWNSPLYCDRNHTQDLAISTPWGVLTDFLALPVDAATATPAGRRRLTGMAAYGMTAAHTTPVCRKPTLQQRAESTPLSAARRLLQIQLDLAQGAGADQDIDPNYDADQTQNSASSPSGAQGTFNWLVDSVLSLPRSRAMVMRRLRTLMDEFTQGKLEETVTKWHNNVRDEAIRDNAKWKNPGNPDTGYSQLIQEQLPIRKSQLYQTYSQGGAHPLIPDTQSSIVSLGVGAMSDSYGGMVEISNPGNDAIDVSGFKLTDGLTFSFIPGTVIPPSDSVHVVGDVAGFLSANAGQGLFVTGPASAGSGGGVTLTDAAGNTVASGRR